MRSSATSARRRVPAAWDFCKKNRDCAKASFPVETPEQSSLQQAAMPRAFKRSTATSARRRVPATGPTPATGPGPAMGPATGHGDGSGYGTRRWVRLRDTAMGPATGHGDGSQRRKRRWVKADQHWAPRSALGSKISTGLLDPNRADGGRLQWPGNGRRANKLHIRKRGGLVFNW
jgi:hypothetical protein